ncbi:MAG: DUF4276 family protein, partial [Acidobacteria bacterium]|nr:DUF4276 family protein [Acidobacteriota bacterium]
GRRFQGGIRSYQRFRREVLRLLGDTGATMVTTMIDFYGLPADFPGVADLPAESDPYTRVHHLERSLLEDLGWPGRLFAYFSLHEFEALLLSSPLELNEEFRSSSSERGFEAVMPSGMGPEEVNDGPETHPSARILALVPSYRKAVHGPLIAARIGLPALRERCPHFNHWVTALENLAAGGEGTRP